MAYPHAVAAPQLADANHDALIIIGDDFSSLAETSCRRTYWQTSDITCY